MPTPRHWPTSPTISRVTTARSDALRLCADAWLLLHGRRDLVAGALFVHPQTVRYRMAQLRELFGDRLDDPEEVLRLTLALAGTRPATPTGPVLPAAPHPATTAHAQATQLKTSLRRKVR